MKLNHKVFGQGDPLIILHGLFGSLENWQTLAKEFAKNFTVFIIDQRNHGRSPHTDAMSYPLMAEDLREFMEQHWVYKAHILGHSMGGKTAMQFALEYPDMVDKLVVVDIGPWKNEAGHDQIFKALTALDLSEITSRKEAGEQLAARISQEDVRLFLLKNISRNKKGGYEWKMNLPAIHKNYIEILAAVNGEGPCEGPALFIKGGKSDYIADEDFARIQRLFPAAELVTVQGAGHWVHAEAPTELSDLVKRFLKDGRSV